MEDKLIEYADKIVAALESGVDFASEQAPLLIQEVLTYYLVTNSIWTIFFILVTIYLIKPIRHFNAKGDDAIFAFSLMFIFSLLFSLYCAFNVIKILVAPRLFLIQKLAEIL